MAAAIIYAAQSKAIRRIVVDEVALMLPSHVGPGEAMYVLPDRDALPPGQTYPDLAHCEALIAKFTGVQPASSRCVVLDQNMKVSALVMADPLLDNVVDGHIVRDAMASVGAVLASDGTFSTPVLADPVSAIDPASAA